jgi:type II secretory pathway pseudopilin PulG
LRYMKAHGIKAEGGFTLLELGLVMAISGLLLAGIIATSSGSQNRTAFTASMDTLLNTAKDVQNQSYATISDRTGSQTGDSPYLIFGKAMIFNSTSPTTYTVATLIGDNNAADPLEECDDATVTLPGDVTYSDHTRAAIIFRHDPDQVYIATDYIVSQPPNGTECSNPGLDTGWRPPPITNWSTLLATVANPLAGPVASGLNWLIPPAHAFGSDLLNVNNYTPTGPFYATITLDFADPANSSQDGMLTADPGTNTLTRSFLF